jgi:hypothetical protein
LIRRFVLRCVACGLCVATSFATPARAGTAIGGGVFFPSDGSPSAGGIATLGLSSVPVVPVGPQLSVAALGGGRFAATIEIQASAAGNYFGGGAGVGKFRTNGQAGTMLDVLAGTRIAPLLSVQARFYDGLGGNAGSSAYLGLSLSL